MHVAAHSVSTASFHTGKLWRRLKLSSSISGQSMVAGSTATCVSRKNRQKSSLCSCDPTMRERGILVPLCGTAVEVSMLEIHSLFCQRLALSWRLSGAAPVCFRQHLPHSPGSDSTCWHSGRRVQHARSCGKLELLSLAVPDACPLPLFQRARSRPLPGEVLGSAPASQREWKKAAL